MDGESLVYRLQQVLREASTSSFLDTRTSYDALFEGAKRVNQRVKYLTGQQAITTVASQVAYDLNADFMSTYFVDDMNRLIVKHTTAGGAITFITWRDYDKIKQNTNTTAVPVPNNFCVAPKQSLTARITGTASANGALSYEECTLTDTSSSTKFSNVSVGDSVHNTTDSSEGIVIEKTSNTALVTVLFGGTNNYWTSGNAYVIVPQGLKQLILDPSSSVAGDTVTVDYLQTPTPVYSSYRTYGIDQNYEMAIVYYAAWFYRAKDKDTSDYFYKEFERELREGNALTNRALNRGSSIKVNLKKRSFGDRSYR